MTENLRIALFSGNYNYQADGANKALNKLVSFLERMGADVLVFSPTTSTPAFDPSGQLVSVPSIPVLGRGEYRIGLGLNRDLKQRIREFNPDVFHLSAPDLLGHSAMSFAQTLNRPVVASFHTRFDTYFSYYGLGSVEAFVKKRLAAFYRRCEYVYVPSPSMRDVLKDDGIIGSNMKIWSRGIDHETFNPRYRSLSWRQERGIEESDIAVAFVGRLVREKGLNAYADLIDALTSRNLPIKPIIIGDGPEFQVVKKRLPDAVMTGHLSRSDLSTAYASVDVFINPSLTETFGNVTLEAMASGLPTVCLKATGSADLVDDGVTGWLIDSASSPEWIDKTALLCADENMRRQMGRMGCVKSAQYNWSVILQGLLEDYHDLARKSIRPCSRSEKANAILMTSAANVS